MTNGEKKTPLFSGNHLRIIGYFEHNFQMGRECTLVYFTEQQLYITVSSVHTKKSTINSIQLSINKYIIMKYYLKFI